MAQAGRDQNFVPTLLGVSNSDGTTPIAVYADPSTHRLLVDVAGGGTGTVTSITGSTGITLTPNPITTTGTVAIADTAVTPGSYTLASITVDQQGRITAASNGSAGSGTVTTLSVVSANGFAGTVANATTTPAITLTTTITGLLKGNATAISAATAGSDYAVGSIGLSGGQTIAGSTLTTENLTLRANAADLTTGQVNITSSKEATNTTTASVALSGGLAVAKRVYALDMTVTNTITGSVSGNAATVTTNANLTGVITSSGNATSIASQTGTGTKFVVDTSPSLVTPALGVATATSLAIGGATIGSNGLAVTGHLLLEGVTSTGATGTGKLVFDTAPTLGVVTATSVTGNVILGAANTLSLAVTTSDGTASGPQTSSFNAGYTTVLGDLVYLDSSATWQKADADASAATYSSLLGIALQGSITSGNPLTVALPGSFVYMATAFPTLTIGAPVYMSATAGAVTQTAPVTTDSATRIIGHAVHADKIFFNPSNDWITHT